MNIANSNHSPSERRGAQSASLFHANVVISSNPFGLMNPGVSTFFLLRLFYCVRRYSIHSNLIRIIANISPDHILRNISFLRHPFWISALEDWWVLAHCSPSVMYRLNGRNTRRCALWWLSGREQLNYIRTKDMLMNIRIVRECAHMNNGRCVFLQLFVSWAIAILIWYGWN